ncbi:MAG: class I SAM-dependent methyltransferase [Acidobacteriota bacterium]
MRPIDLPTHETCLFILQQLASQQARILEVGSGNGELALQLQSLGHEVVAIDSSIEAVQQAKQLGVDARVAQWPDFEENNFDLILFTRSLHHIHPISKAVEQANRLLKPDGLVIMEDFAFNEVSPATVEWFYGILSLLDSCDRLLLEEDSFGKQLLLGEGSLEIWHHNHDHDLHPAPVMLTALEDQFESILQTTAPYLYRYLYPLLTENEMGYRIIARVLDLEKRMANAGLVSLIGRRFVGRKRETQSNQH